MLRRLRDLWTALVTSLWLLPAAIVAAGVALAAGLVWLPPSLSDQTLQKFPRLFGAGADGARGMLSTIAGSMMTVAGVTFSITIAAVAQTSMQYTPRVMRTFMRDRANQAVLGIFVGIFAYCLVVLRTIRGGDQGAFVPALAVLGGFVLALVGVGVLVYFIVHISQSLQAAAILERVRDETVAAVTGLFPQELGEPAGDAAAAHERAAALAHASWQPLYARTSGYVQRVDEDGLLAFARERDVVVRMRLGVGAFAVAGAPLAEIVAPDGSRPQGLDADATEQALNALYMVSPYRTVDQDAEFGLLQISDIALKALSPGVNDTTTAVTCVGHLTAVLTALARRRMPDPVRVDTGRVRVLAAGPTFVSLAATAFDDVRRSAASNVTVLARLLDALHTIGCCTTDPARRGVLAAHASLVAGAAERNVEAPEDRAMLARRAVAVGRALVPDAAAEPEVEALRAAG